MELALILCIFPHLCEIIDQDTCCSMDSSISGFYESNNEERKYVPDGCSHF